MARGKSHLLLVFSDPYFERNAGNDEIIGQLLNKVNNVDIKAVSDIKRYGTKKTILPVIISSSYNDLGSGIPFVALNRGN